MQNRKWGESVEIAEYIFSNQFHMQCYYKYFDEKPNIYPLKERRNVSVYIQRFVKVIVNKYKYIYVYTFTDST